MLTESPDPPYLLPQTCSNVLHLRRLQSDLGGLLGTRSANSVARSTLRRTSSSRRIRTFTLGLALWKDRPPRSEDVLAGCHPSACVEEGMRGDVGGRVWDGRAQGGTGDVAVQRRRRGPFDGAPSVRGRATDHLLRRRRLRVRSNLFFSSAGTFTAARSDTRLHLCTTGAARLSLDPSRMAF